MPKSLLEYQLEKAGQLTETCWAARLEPKSEWEVIASYKVNHQQHAVLANSIRQLKVKAWLNIPLPGKQRRSQFLSFLSARKKVRLVLDYS